MLKWQHCFSKSPPTVSPQIKEVIACAISAFEEVLMYVCQQEHSRVLIVNLGLGVLPVFLNKQPPFFFLPNQYALKRLCVSFQSAFQHPVSSSILPHCTTQEHRQKSREFPNAINQDRQTDLQLSFTLSPPLS